MASSFAAALLDELMGRNRNSLPNEQVKELRWDDDEVCKYHLCGFCPYELFTNTRADLGPCLNIHDDELRKAYEKSSRYYRMGYEADLVKFLQQNIISEVDRKIKRGQARLALSASGAIAAPQNAREEKIAMLTAKINDLVDKAEALGCEGKVEEAQGVMKLCDQLREERTQLEHQEYGGQMSNQAKEMEVCLICGAFLVKNDAPQRVEEHISGKQHIGYAKVRDYLKAYSSGELRRKTQDDSDRTRDKGDARSAKDRADREREREKEREERRRKDEEERKVTAAREEERKEFEAKVRREKEEKEQRDLDEDKRRKEKLIQDERDREKRRTAEKKRSRSRSSGRRRSRSRSRRSRSRERDRSRRRSRENSWERRRRDDSREKRRRDESRERKRRSRSRDHRRSRSRSYGRNNQDKDRREKRLSRESDHDNRKSKDRDSKDRESRHRSRERKSDEKSESLMA